MITLAELYRHAADNIEGGRPETHGLEFHDLRDGWRETERNTLRGVLEGIGARGDRYRIAPKTIRIGDIDVPAPVIAPLEMGQEYCVASTSRRATSIHCTWDNDIYDMIMLERRLIHLTPEAAEAHADALILISGGKVN